MSPIKVEKESHNFGRQTFVVPEGEKHIIKIVGRRRLILYGSFLGGNLVDIPNTRYPENYTNTRLNIFNNPVNMEVRESGEKNTTRFTFSGILVDL